MRTIKSLLLVLISLCIFNSCKKDKADTAHPTPIAYYKLDNEDVSNSISDALDGQAVDNLASITDSFNTLDASLYFTGDGYVEVQDSDLIDFPGNQFTLSLWIRPDKIRSSYLINKASNGNKHNAYSLDIYPGVVRAYVRNSNDDQYVIEGTTLIKKSVWQHIAATYNGKQLTIFLNGKKEGSVAVTGTLVNTMGDLAIGTAKEYYPSTSFAGRMDNVKIYDKALTDAQVDDLYKKYND